MCESEAWRPLRLVTSMRTEYQLYMRRLRLPLSLLQLLQDEGRAANLLVVSCAVVKSGCFLAAVLAVALIE